MLRKSFIVGIVTTVAAFAQYGRPEFSREVFSPKLNPDGEEVEVIVKFKSEGNARGARAAGFARRHGLNPTHDHALIGSHAYRLRRVDVDRLSADPDVEFIAPDRVVRPTMDRSRAAVMATNATNRTGLDGRGITVAVIDSGISATNGALGSGGTNQVLYQKSFIPNVTSTADEYGHGTHVASIIAGQGMGSVESYRGMADGAGVLNLRVLDKDGAGKDSYVIAALNWVVANKATYNIRVVNLSLGRPVYGSYKVDPLCLAVEAVWKAGIVVVVAAGNEGRNNSSNTGGYGTIMAPGNDPYAITVGAAKAGSTNSRVDDMPTSYSSKGPSMVDHIVKPDLLAPGNRVVALGAGALLSGNPANVVDANYKYMMLSGTSMAAPVVSGAVALLLQSEPALTPDQVKARLMKNAWRGFAPSASVIDNGKTYTVRNDIFSIGAGYLDIDAALADSAYRPLGQAQSPAAVYDAATKKATLVKGSNVIWGEAAAPFNVIWGSNVLAGANVIWGENVIWGDSTSGCNVIWGESAIYSATSTVSGEAASLLLKGEN